MSLGRASVEPRSSNASTLLNSFASISGSDNDDDSIDYETGLENVTYDPNDPWSSPRGRPRESTPPLPQRNYCPGVTALARSLKQRSVYTGNFKMSLEKRFYHESLPAPEPLSRVEQLVQEARSLSSLGFNPSRRRTAVREPRLPSLKTTPRLARKLQLLEEVDTADFPENLGKRRSRRKRRY